MIIFLNRNGDTVSATAEESIGRGSVNASSIYIVAPFVSSSVVQLSFVLPDGTGIYGGVAGEVAKATALSEVTVQEGYSVWKWDIDARVTKLAGTVGYTISITDEHGARFTFGGSFRVDRGAPVQIMAPKPKQADWSDDDWSALVQVLSGAEPNAEAAASSATAAASSATAAKESETMSINAANASESFKQSAEAAQTAAEAAQVAAEKAAEEVASVADIVQTTGQSIDKVMSQKATTDALKEKIDNPEVSPTVGTVLKVTAVNDDGTFTCAWTEESGKVDVKIDGKSIVRDGVANIPYASYEHTGIVKVQNRYGIDINSYNGMIYLYPTNNAEISARNTTNRRAILIGNLDHAVKAAMCDGKGAAWTDTEKAAARSRMGVINGSTGKNFSFSLVTMPDSAEQLYTDTNVNKTLCRMTKENFLAFAPSCTDETYERMLQGALVTQNDGAGAAVSSTLITYPPRYVGVGMRIPQEWLNASTLLSVMGDRRIAFFPDFETGHESDIYFVYENNSQKPIVNIIAY